MKWFLSMLDFALVVVFVSVLLVTVFGVAFTPKAEAKTPACIEMEALQRQVRTLELRLYKLEAMQNEMFVNMVTLRKARGFQH